MLTRKAKETDMDFNFDEIIDRIGNDDAKYDERANNTERR